MASPPPPRSRGFRRSGAAGLVLLMPWYVACAGFWEKIQRHEHAQSWSHAVDLAESNRCEEALFSIERAQNARSLSRRFAAESTRLKAACLERTGREQEALAHYRFIRDFLGDSATAALLPAEAMDETVVASPSPSQPPRAETKLPVTRYSRAALAAGIKGDVEVRYRVDSSGRAEQIRVANESHPLLASWAIEAVARGEFGVADVSNDRTERAAVFHFLTRNEAAKVSPSRQTRAAPASRVVEP